jgi:hypothetical protein
MPRSIPAETKRGPGHMGVPFYNALNVIVLAAGDESRWP